MKINELNIRELEMVKEKMLEEYEEDSITLEEYCDKYVRKCECGKVYTVDSISMFNDMCPECYSYYTGESNDNEYEIDQYDIYSDNKLMEGI